MTLTREQIAEIIRAVAELPDRTSPDDQPDMMLVTHEELEGILERVRASEPPTEESATCPVELEEAREMVKRLRSRAAGFRTSSYGRLIGEADEKLDDAAADMLERLAAAEGQR